MEAANIKPINHNSVHKICSGQVVLTLASAVKELVENSIDAGATIIEVKLKEYGTKLIEVIDNGKGVKGSDFLSITLKHHTSKISDFSDVEFVSTFGFRGEALSSLCALSNVEIITCHNDSAVGSLLVYDHDGTLVKSSSTPRQIGTTVILKDLFFTLPVRHREFHRNIRREYAKMIQLLSAYCLISVNKRITCTNITDKGRKTIVLSTNSSDNLKDNIACIFGSKQVNNLMKFVQHAPSESVLEEYFLPQSDLEKCRLFCLEGYISSSAHQEGRSSTDRQFFFINGRPCDLYKISKLINEVYHFFNKAQYPFVFLNIILNEGSVDVNVTPDKRQIFIPDEKLLLCIVKSSLYQMYQLQSSQIKVSPASSFFQKSSPDISHKFPVETENQLPTLSQTTERFMKRKAGSCIDDNEDENLFSPPFKSLRKDELNQYVKEKSKQLEKDHPVNIQDSSDSGILCMEITSPSSPSYAAFGELKSESPKKVKKDLSQVTDINIALTLPFNEEKAFRNTPHSGSLNLKDILQKSYRGNIILNCNTSNKESKRNKQKVGFNEKIINFFSKTSSKSLNVCEGNEDPKPSVAYGKATSNLCSEVLIPGVHIVDSMENDEALDEPHMRKKKIKTITFSIEAIRKSLDTKNKTNLTESISYRKFRSKIAPTENHSAEEELKKEINKENFSQMSIIGQFNLGFIVTRLNDDLFIIDQHATDEKYNFEMLQKEIVLKTQMLLNPQNLNLSAVSEAVLLDNLHIFEKSGFKFSIDEDNSVGNKIQLISVPVSHNWRFGKEDVDEMIFMLTDNPVSMVRPSRVNQMFASRACRKSVMIGTALTISMMKKLVIHMGETEQPWNCPHGRPTIRHLFNLNLLKSAANE